MSIDPDEEFMMWFPPPFDEEEEERRSSRPPRQLSKWERLGLIIFLAIMGLSCLVCLVQALSEG
jgi:hypothetical protein